MKKYESAQKTQVFLKAALAHMTIRRTGKHLVILAPDGKLFGNKKPVLTYQITKTQGWDEVYGKAYTDMHKDLVEA